MDLEGRKRERLMRQRGRNSENDAVGRRERKRGWGRARKARKRE